jgi:hypothetical protein
VSPTPRLGPLAASRRSSWTGLASATLVYAVLTCVWTWPLARAPHATIADLGDPLHLSWVLAWDAHQLGRDPLHLFDANAFYPAPASLAFGDHLLPEALLVAPLFWATGNAVLAFNACVAAGLLLSALTMRWLVLRLTGAPAAALLAGAVYAFNGFTLSESLRVQVVHLQWWPLALLLLGRFVVAGAWRDALGGAALLALQGLSGTYYLVYSALGAPPALLTAYWAQHRRPSRRDLVRLATAGLVVGLPLLILLEPYFARLDARAAVPASAGVDLLSHVLPPRDAALWSGLPWTSVRGQEFKGLLGAALMLLGAWRLRRLGPGLARVVGVVALLAAAAGVVLSLGPTVSVGGRPLLPGPLVPLLRLLPLDGLSDTPRFNALAVLGGAVLAGLGVAGLLARLSSPGRHAVAALLLVLLPLEHWRRTGYGYPIAAGASVPAAYRWLGQARPGPVADLPLYPIGQKRFWASYLYFSTVHWQPVPIGRTSFYPPWHELLAWTLLDFPDDRSIGVLDRLGVRTLVVHPRLWSEPERATALAAVERHPRLERLGRFDDVPPLEPDLLRVGLERVYRIRPEAASARPCQPADEIPRERWSFWTPIPGEPERARDGDSRTAWSTSRPQRSGDVLRVRFRWVEPVAAIVMETSSLGFPRNLVLEGKLDREEYRALPYADGTAERWQTLQGLLRGEPFARWILRIPRQELRAFSLSVGSIPEYPWPPWSVGEIRAFRECR